MLTAAAYDIHAEQLLEKMRRFHAAMEGAGIPYRIIGGLATFIHVYERHPTRARMTQDVDAGVARDDLQRIIRAVESGGFVYRNLAGVDMLLDPGKPSARSAIHLIFIGEVRPGELADIPASDPVRTKEGIWICPVADLVRMKLTSFRRSTSRTSMVWGSSLRKSRRPFRILCESVFTKSAPWSSTQTGRQWERPHVKPSWNRQVALQSGRGSASFRVADDPLGVRNPRAMDGPKAIRHDDFAASNGQLPDCAFPNTYPRFVETEKAR